MAAPTNALQLLDDLVVRREVSTRFYEVYCAQTRQSERAAFGVVGTFAGRLLGKLTGLISRSSRPAESVRSYVRTINELSDEEVKRFGALVLGLDTPDTGNEAAHLEQPAERHSQDPTNRTPHGLHFVKLPQSRC